MGEKIRSTSKSTGKENPLNSQIFFIPLEAILHHMSSRKDIEDYPVLGDNDYLSVFIPAQKRSLVFQVVTKVNATTPIINYGALPLTSGLTLSLYAGGSVNVPADGQLPPGSYTSKGVKFPLPGSMTGSYDNNDMWYTNEEYRDRIFRIILQTDPFVRVGLEYPLNVKQYRFQRDNVQVGPETDFGFADGVIETIQFPNIHQGWLFGNPTNLPLYTECRFRYEELIIRTPNDSEVIYDVLAGNIPRYQVNLPISVQDPSLQQNLLKNYGYYGFDTTLVSDKVAALKSISDNLTKVLI